MSTPTASITEIAPDLHRISVAMPPEFIPGGFSFNQYLLLDEQPLLFHTGPRKLFPLVRAQIEKVLPIEQLRYIAFSHVEADECGALHDFLASAPNARPSRTLFCGDLFTQPGSGEQALVHEDIVESSEVFRRQMDYFSHGLHAPALTDKLARLRPALLACMHGSAWSGDGAAHLRKLGQSLAASMH